jgi:hypothetical protein
LRNARLSFAKTSPHKKIIGHLAAGPCWHWVKPGRLEDTQKEEELTALKLEKRETRSNNNSNTGSTKSPETTLRGYQELLD